MIYIFNPEKRDEWNLYYLILFLSFSFILFATKIALEKFVKHKSNKILKLITALNIILINIGPFSLLLLALLFIRIFIHGALFYYIYFTAFYAVIYGTLLFISYKSEFADFFGVSFFTLIIGLMVLITALSFKAPNVHKGILLFIIELILSFVFSFILYLNICKKKISEERFNNQKSIFRLLTTIGTLGLFCTNLISIAYNLKTSFNTQFYGFDMIILFLIYPIYIGLLMTDVLIITVKAWKNHFRSLENLIRRNL